METAPWGEMTAIDGNAQVTRSMWDMQNPRPYLVQISLKSAL